MDPRRQYTRSLIQEAFLELMQNKPIGKITVKAICEAAAISRPTFYSYYDDVYDLIKQMEDSFIMKIKKEIPNHVLESKKQQQVYQAIGNIYLQNKKLVLAFYGIYGDISFHRRLIETMLATTREMEKMYYPQLDSYALHLTFRFMYEGVAAIYYEWLLNYPQMSSDEIASIIVNIIFKRITYQKKYLSSEISNK